MSRNTREPAGQRAEQRVEEALAQAAARARAIAAETESRMGALIDEQARRMRELAARTASPVFEPPPHAGNDRTRRDPLPALPVDTERFRQAVARRAYYKAQQRGFGQGLETADWLEAERELLRTLPPFHRGPEV